MLGLMLYHLVRWLGLMLGTALWYGFYGETLSSAAAFDARMDSLRRDIGDRGRANVSNSASALHLELRASKLSVLRKRARQSGVSEADLERADDAADIKNAVIDLILSAESESSDSNRMRQELCALDLPALRKEAVAAGVSEQDLDDAYDAHDVKLAMIDLVLARKAAASAPQGAEAEADPELEEMD